MMVDSASPDRSSSRTRRVGTARDVDGSLPQRTPAVQSGQEQQVFDDRAHLNQLRNAGPRARSPPRACSGWCLVNFGFPSQRAPRPSTACAPAAPLRPRYLTPRSQHWPEWITTLRPPCVSCYGSVTTAATRRVWCCRWPLAVVHRFISGSARPVADQRSAPLEAGGIAPSLRWPIPPPGPPAPLPFWTAVKSKFLSNFTVNVRAIGLGHVRLVCCAVRVGLDPVGGAAGDRLEGTCLRGRPVGTGQSLLTSAYGGGGIGWGSRTHRG